MHCTLNLGAQRQNLALAMAAPCARASSLAQITSESMPLVAHVDAESTIHRGHDVFPADEIGVTADALGHEFRVLDVGRLALDHSGDE